MADPERKGCASVVYALLKITVYVSILPCIIAMLLLAAKVGGGIPSLEDIRIVIKEFKGLELSRAALAANFLVAVVAIACLGSEELSDRVERCLGVLVQGLFNLSVRERHDSSSQASGGKDVFVVFALFLLSVTTVLVIDTVDRMLTSLLFIPL